MKKIVQEDPLGCAIACLASILNISYKNALSLVPNGASRAKTEGFYCRDLVRTLNESGKEYIFKHLKGEVESPAGSIIYIKKSIQYPAGHYFARSEEGFMDPWINFPHTPRESGFRKELPGQMQYLVFRKKP